MSHSVIEYRLIGVKEVQIPEKRGHGAKSCQDMLTTYGIKLVIVE